MTGRIDRFAAAAVLCVGLGACAERPAARVVSNEKKGGHEMAVTKQPWGAADGKPVELYTLTNANGLRAEITNYGGIVVRLFVPDREGRPADIVLGYDRLVDYLKDTPYFGAIVGRYGNRIAKGRFTLDGVEYRLATNDGDNHLHGGVKGFDKVLWKAEPLAKGNAVGLRLRYTSKDGEEGYPGTLKVAVSYLLTNDNELKIEYEAETDRPTPVNLTHHGYWNLAGHGEGDILSHVLMLNADRFLPVDEGLIPTGELRPVKGTPMDFTTATAIGARIHQDDEQLRRGKGYDHCWVLTRRGAGLSLAASVYETTSGRTMEVWTTEPAIQFYSGNFLDGSNVGKGGKVYSHRYGFCLETEHYPDSPNRPEFPSTVLRPGKRYQTTTIYRFGVK